MVDLLQHFSVQNIFLFVVLFALSIKGLITFFDWFSERVKKSVHKSDKSEHLERYINNHEDEIKELKQSIQALSKKVDMLVDSDKDAIKAYITKEHREFVYQQKWIDNYNLNCIEQRYAHYKDEGGNSFIAELMKELRQLPKEPPRDPD